MAVLSQHLPLQNVIAKVLKACKVNRFNVSMGYRKFSAQQIFTGSQLVDNQVLITDENGKVEALIPRRDAGDDMQVLEGILTPGFINAHCHLELSHLKGVVPTGTGMVDFLLSVMSQRTADEATIYQAIAAAEAAMLQNGIVAVGDICNTAFTIPQKENENLYYQNFIEATGFVSATADARFGSAKAVWDQFQAALPAGRNHQGARSSVVPHAPYSVSEALFSLISNMAGNTLLTMHNQESADEDLFIRTGVGAFNRLYKTLGLDISFYQPSGKSSLQTTLPRFNKDQHLILVHNVTTTADDLRYLQQGQQAGNVPVVHFCLCPLANLYIGNGLPNVELLRKESANILVGTDSLASNHQLSVIAELNVLHRHFPAIPIEELLQWATINGAVALGISDRYGSFEAGKRPGIVLVDTVLSEAKRLL